MPSLKTLIISAEKILSQVKSQLFILLLLAVSLNVNTLFNQYAYDDQLVITNNNLVKKGLSGIPELLKTEYFYGVLSKESGLTGARYRPLSLIVFAAEYQFFRGNAMISHLINILLFAVLIALLFKLLQSYLFRAKNPYLSFVTCLLFLAHPIHTEVIANVKSRDELITFIFLIISLITFIKYFEEKKPKFVVISLSCFFLALLTRETAVTFVAVIPLVLIFFFNQQIKKSLKLVIPYLFVFAGYMAIRYLVVGLNYHPAENVESSPYLLATSSEAFATKCFIVLKYIELTLIPYQLSYDYGYNQIPYIELGSIKFMLSFSVMLALLAYALYSFKVKSIYSFCIIYFFITLSVGTNFIVDLGAPMAERMLFQPSLAFCIALASIFLETGRRIKALPIVLTLAVLTAYSIKTVARNADWKNNETLFLKDINAAPNSLRTNQYVIDIYMPKAIKATDMELKKEYFSKAISIAEHMLMVCPDDAAATESIEAAYCGLLDCFTSSEDFLNAYNFHPDDPNTLKLKEFLSNVLYKRGNGVSDMGNIVEAIKYYTKSVELNSSNAEAWYNLGGNYFLKNDTIRGREAWNNVSKLDPNHPLRKEDFLKK